MKKDVQLLKALFKFGRFVGVTFARKRRNQSTKWVSAQKLFIFILLLSSIVGNILSMINRWYGFWTESTLSQITSEFIECLTELSLMVSLFWGALTNADKWKDLFISIRKVDETLAMENFDVDLSIYAYMAKIFLLHIIYACIQALEVISWYKKATSQIECGYILYRIIAYYRLYITVFSVSVIGILRRRFDFIETFLKNLLAKKTVIISRDTDQMMLDKLFVLRRVYGRLDRIVGDINAIFGYSILFGTLANFLLVLENLNYIVQYTGTSDMEFNLMFFLVNGIYAVVYCYSTIITVMSCDGVEKTARRLVTTCYLCPDILEKTPVNDEIIAFAEVAEQLAPRFSAAGFFHVNQKVLSTLFQATITYFIIIIQFNQAV
ncbi:hypothetical protein JTB14_007091 [Gonioctena quinquepunctata]|nr:hypothetical protein JTB14_007091 [Gonioctena quinquepunctata]